MAEQKRYSVQKWNRPALHAAAMRCGICGPADHLMIGIDLLARDDKTFAHGHFDIPTAKQFLSDLADIIDEAECMVATKQ